MSFLEINGWTVPVKSCQRGRRLLGGKGRAYDGTPQTQDRGRKLSLECETNQLTELVREALAGIVNGDGFVWPWSSDLYSHKGVGPASGTDAATQLDYLAGDGDPIVTMHYLLDGLSSNYTPHRNGILSVDPATVNLLDADDRDCEASGGFTSINGATVDTSTTHYVQGTKSVLIDTDGGGGDTEGAFVNCDPGAGSATKTYVGSIYAKVHDPDTSGEGVQVTLQDNTNAAAGDSIDVFPSGDADEWVRIAVTITIGGVDCRDLMLIIKETAQDSNLTIYVDKLQVEEQDYPTAWVDGTRAAADDLAYDFDFDYDWVDWSVGVWFWGPEVARLPAGFGAAVLWAFGTSSVYATMYRAAGTTDQLTWGVTDADGTSVTLTTDAGDVDWEAWNFIAVSYRTDPETGETRFTVTLINGTDTYSYTDNSACAFVPPTGGSLAIGNDSGSYQWLGHLGELMLFPFAVPAAMWTGIASTLGDTGDGSADAKALPQWPRKYVTGDALVNLGVAQLAYAKLFEGEAGNENMVYADGANNLATLAFTLEQV